MVAAVALAASGAAACSSGGGEADGAASVPEYTPEATDAATEAASPTPTPPSGGAMSLADGDPVTPETLSDPELGYTVVSIPEGLDDAQTEALVDYVAYDEATWHIWFNNEGKDTMGNYATGEFLDLILVNAAKQGDGHANPPVRVSVNEVTVDPSGDVATVTVCVDNRQMTRVDAAGNDVTDPADQIQFPETTYMVPGPDGHWVADGGKRGDINSCSVN